MCYACTPLVRNGKGMELRYLFMADFMAIQYNDLCYQSPKTSDTSDLFLHNESYGLSKSKQREWKHSPDLHSTVL